LLLSLFPGLAPWAFLSRPCGASFAPETSSARAPGEAFDIGVGVSLSRSQEVLIAQGGGEPPSAMEDGPHPGA